MLLRDHPLMRYRGLPNWAPASLWIKAIKQKINSLIGNAVVWPSIQTELGDYKVYFKGNVLNAGSGGDDISELITGRIYNQDIVKWNENVHFVSPLNKIPVEDGFFDAIICNAVLEHVENPVEIIRELSRVLKSGGYLYLCIPFMQPEHKAPADYQRYTIDGIQKLVTDQSFEVVTAEGVHTVYHTLGWIVQEWLQAKKTPIYILLRTTLFPLLRYKTKHSRTYVHSLASAYRVLAKKP